MTENGRREAIMAALAEYKQRGAMQETYRASVRGVQTTLEVVDVGLMLPVLNTASSRIAAQLEDHPQKKVVDDDPNGDEAQRVVSDLVRKVHDHADELKENLLLEGQNEPGLITRSGKLINANTRCVLLRELLRDGLSSVATLRVAVLPGDLTNDELLEIELVLQQQRTFKDEYSLVNELLMIRKLHETGMTDAQIAQKRRFVKNGASEVKRRREILFLMERARRLFDPMLPLATLDIKHSQLQNWDDLLREVKKLPNQLQDEHIRRWLFAVLVGVDSVHDLRKAKGTWIETHLVPELKDRPELASLVDENLIDEVSVAAPELDPEAELPLPGLELFGDEEEGKVVSEEPSAAVQSLLTTIVKVQAEPDGWLELPDGSQKTGAELRAQLKTLVSSALDSSYREIGAGNRVEKQLNLLNRARIALRDAHTALSEVVGDEEFEERIPQARETLDEVQAFAERIRVQLSRVAEPYDA